VLTKWVYIGDYQWNHRRKFFFGIPIGESAGDCATSLYGDPSLNPSVIMSVKSSKKTTSSHHCNLKKKQYNPLAIRSVYTDRNGDIIIFISLVFADFLQCKSIFLVENFTLIRY
jgi:hypothetical protein